MVQDHRARQYAATHRRIYHAAMELFAESGYEEVQVARLAAAAGVSVPTFYAHYPRKDDLVMGLPERAEVAGLLAAVPADLPIAERIRQVILFFLRGIEQDRRSDALARWQLIAATPRLRLRAAEYERATAQMVVEALGEEERKDPATSVVVTAHLSAYTHAVLRWAESGGRQSLIALTEESLDALRML